MPKLRLVQAAHPNIAHCVINNGYRIRKGGVGTVSIIVKLQAMLSTQAKISRKHRTGLLAQSSRIQSRVFLKSSFKAFYQQFQEWYSILRDLR